MSYPHIKDENQDFKRWNHQSKPILKWNSQRYSQNFQQTKLFMEKEVARGEKCWGRLWRSQLTFCKLFFLLLWLAWSSTQREDAECLSMSSEGWAVREWLDGWWVDVSIYARGDSERIVSGWGEGECATNNGFVATWVVGGWVDGWFINEWVGCWMYCLFIYRGVQPFGVSEPHWKKSGFGPYIKYTATHNHTQKKNTSCFK